MAEPNSSTAPQLPPLTRIEHEAASISVKVIEELVRATKKFPTWPTDPLHAVAIVAEESGELVKAVLQMVYEPGRVHLPDVREGAIQTAAMAIRFLLSLDRYEWQPGRQHEQGEEADRPADGVGREATGLGSQSETCPECGGGGKRHGEACPGCGSGSQSTNESDVVTASDLDSISRSFISISEERELRRQVGALEARIAEMAGEVVGALGVESPGEYFAETWNEAMEAIQWMIAPRDRGLSARDYAKLAEWSRMADRPDPNTHFTAGAARDAANAFNEGIEAREVEA